ASPRWVALGGTGGGQITAAPAGTIGVVGAATGALAGITGAAGGSSGMRRAAGAATCAAAAGGGTNLFTGRSINRRSLADESMWSELIEAAFSANASISA